MYLPTNKEGISKGLGLFLMEQRLKQHLTITQMSQNLGVRPAKLSKMETGAYRFTLDDVALLSVKLNVEIIFSPKTSKPKTNKPKTKKSGHPLLNDFFEQPIFEEE